MTNYKKGYIKNNNSIFVPKEEESYTIGSPPGNFYEYEVYAILENERQGNKGPCIHFKFWSAVPPQKITLWDGYVAEWTNSKMPLNHSGGGRNRIDQLYYVMYTLTDDWWGEQYTYFKLTGVAERPRLGYYIYDLFDISGADGDGRIELASSVRWVDYQKDSAIVVKGNTQFPSSWPGSRMDSVVLRASEGWDLKWRKDIDYEQSFIRVNHCVLSGATPKINPALYKNFSYDSGKITLTTTDNSTYTLTIPEEDFEIGIGSYKVYRYDIMLKFNYTGWGGSADKFSQCMLTYYSTVDLDLSDAGGSGDIDTDGWRGGSDSSTYYWKKVYDYILAPIYHTDGEISLYFNDNELKAYVNEMSMGFTDVYKITISAGGGTTRGYTQNLDNSFELNFNSGVPNLQVIVNRAVIYEC